MKINNIKGATPLDPDTLAGLIPDIKTQAELDLLEAENILEAQYKYEFKKHLNLLEVSFIFEVHKDMFDQVWTWAGEQRKVNTNIGIEKENIFQALRVHLDDTKFWLKNNTYPLIETAARFHHKLVQIHIFPNGNGRHARLMTDLLMYKFDGPEPNWGASNLVHEGVSRELYLNALKKADQNDFGELIKFMSGG